ncbi:molybdate transport system regulatory protein [Sedimentibacter acidaminivorans]|jgi:molybdate transport system regulatory protein|uniref:Molybdate transport system regulatory protein n=1 Tax=Sedimentibacter acidaminivorans TaxID=913099 RepID=A0ABS4GE23_9FIRM|nr:LysR family transcriptional regulator [Sedimentibacter acidaminivorans]MBP1925948.1 molybdate transport system regulatory protein [Sedimentibacter acidaminivorans]
MEKLHLTLRIRLAKEDIFFGPGVVTLLTLTKEFESLNGAAKEMNLSYTKAYKMIKVAEKALGFKLLDRKIGGIGGGGSSLTPECIEFLKQYIAFDKEINSISNELFNKYFKTYL